MNSSVNKPNRYHGRLKMMSRIMLIIAQWLS